MKWYGYLAIPLTLLLFIVSVAAGSFLDPAIGCYPGLFMVVISSLLVAVDSTRIGLRQYKTHVASHPFVLFLVLLLFWIVVFPWYLVIRAKIQSGTLARRYPKFFQMEPTYYSYSKGPFFGRLLRGKFSPYCENCRKWVSLAERMLGIPVPGDTLSEGSESATAQRLIDGDWSVLSSAEPVHDWALQPAIFVALGRCGACSGPFSVRGEVHGEAGRTIYTGVPIFLIEKEKESALQALETAIDRKLIYPTDRMIARAVDLCKELRTTG